ncbi:hypothetical protein [Bacteroides sp.]|uniref:hypothetical protein n=1 Tax=Bacteroides sp. TaxID=29523 RepID=UPI00260BE972|nr:hypothetical protein [Bacteroides sp.]MDD3040028.1 hypothetical protein [Bacteroides sp.]
MKKELVKFVISTTVVVGGLVALVHTNMGKTHKSTTEEKLEASKLIDDVMKSKSVEEFDILRNRMRKS